MNIRTATSFVTAVAALAAVLGLHRADAAQAPAKPLRIVATISDLGDITRAIAGDRAVVSVICEGDRDAHYLQARPSFIMLAREADLWIRNGMDLEIGWEPVILDGARNPAIRVGSPRHLDASENVLKLEVPTQRVTRALGDVHPSGNPHYLLDPLNGRIVAETIAQRLIKIDAAHAETYRTNLAAFQRALDGRMFGAELVQRFGGSALWARQLQGTLDGFLAENNAAGQLGGWTARMRPLRGRRIVTYHKNWSYFANRFGIEVAIELEPKPGIPPSPAHLSRVVELIKEQGITTILQAPIYPTRASERVAAQTGAKLLVRAHAVGGLPAAKDYLSMIDEVVTGLAETL
jgi:zinc/manganese transport system substrate-binding protein